MSDKPSTETAGDLLFALWQQGRKIARLPTHLRPQTRADGYRIQARFQSHSSQPLFGWKIAATSTAGQRHINVEAPLAGRILAERVLRSGARCRLAGNGMRLAEPEFAFTMGSDLLPRGQPYTVAEVLDHVRALHPAIEVPDTRLGEYAQVGAAELIADNACAHDFVLGVESPPVWRELDLSAHAVSLARDHGPPLAGSGGNVLGDPRIALAWLANELSEQQMPLRAGQVVTTGTCMPPVPVREGDCITADFGILGQVAVDFC